MRVLNSSEVNEVSGGEWNVEFDLKIVMLTFSGDESIQDIAAGIGDIYGGIVDSAADFFTWWDPANYYDSACGGGGGR